MEWHDAILPVLLTARAPVLLVHSPTDQWNTSLWTLDHVLSCFKRKTVEVHAASPPVFKHYDPNLELSAKFPPPFRTFYTDATHLHTLLTSATVEKQDAAPPPTGYYVNGELKLLAPQLARDISPTLPFALPSASSTIFVKLWIGGPRVVANLHYDATHNIFHQVHGQKTFTLFPPDAFDSLYVHSRLHPSHRQSLLDLSQPEADLLARFPRYRQALSKRVDVTLQPGETMYLPPFWFHCVLTTTPSISVNVWSHSRELALLESLLENAMPYLVRFEANGWIHNVATHLFALQLYVGDLLGRVFPRPRDWIAMHLDTLDRSLDDGQTWPRHQFECGVAPHRIAHHMQTAMTAFVDATMAATFDKMPTNASKAILMTSFVESLAAHVIDPVYVASFLHSCVATDPAHKTSD
ncbi:hypothetical protein DYB32_006281 [Aphanomyces invadans]|uniref:JmjC domain-containing protein n=1 Tax=Aphanomyces invadans TaxID=157072 RepID=A0A418AS43_9STRA|nr:hypothetical protein DYB32_006281 [Aphanomyces invadans]